jgi:hypothetical protein
VLSKLDRDEAANEGCGKVRAHDRAELLGSLQDEDDDVGRKADSGKDSDVQEAASQLDAGEDLGGDSGWKGGGWRVNMWTS